MAKSSLFREFMGYDSRFPDPFLDMSTAAMPETFRSVLDWAFYVFNRQGTYRAAMERVISYFVTDLVFRNAPDDEQKAWSSRLLEGMSGLGELKSALRNCACFGNEFTSVISLFDRFLACRGRDRYGRPCGRFAPAKRIIADGEYNFRWDSSRFEFVATCPDCKYRGSWLVVDEERPGNESLVIRHWSPYEINLTHDYYSGQSIYWWRIPEHYRTSMFRGDEVSLLNCPQTVMSAIKHKQQFRFHPDAIYHMREPTLAGIENRGWAIPRILLNFRQIFYVQVLHRYNEAIGMDYVIPFRVITPARRGGSSGGTGQLMQPDVLSTFSGSDMARQINQMVTNRAFDPTAWYSLPFPVEYQVLGGDASKLAPRELLDQATEQLLNDTGVPVELYKGTLQLQAAPTALRLFEATWHHIVHESNRWIKWIGSQVSRVTNMGEVDMRLRRVTLADDAMRQQVLLQMYLAGKLSGTTAFRAVDQDWEEEQRMIGAESITQSRIEAEVREDMEQAGFAAQVSKGALPGSGGPLDPEAQAAQGAAGGAPAQAQAQGGQPAGVEQALPVTQYLAQLSPSTPMSLDDMTSAAAALAQDLRELPESVKDSQLRELKQQHPALHGLVKSNMESLRRQARLIGGEMVMSG